MPNGGEANNMAMFPEMSPDYVVVHFEIPEFIFKIVRREDWDRDGYQAEPFISFTEKEMETIAWFMGIWHHDYPDGYHNRGVNAVFRM